MGTDRVHATRFVTSYTICEEVDEKYRLKMLISLGNPVTSLGQIFDYCAGVASVKIRLFPVIKSVELWSEQMCSSFSLCKSHLHSTYYEPLYERSGESSVKSVRTQQTHICVMQDSCGDSLCTAIMYRQFTFLVKSLDIALLKW